jgi:fructokinase
MVSSSNPAESSDAPLSGRPVVVGEVLFDVFPDGREVLGGAPFNVAWNLKGLGEDPLLITRVGSDERAEKILDAMSGWGLDTGGVQRDADRPTGIVRVTIEDDEPSYEIVPDQAWDALDGHEAARAVAGLEISLLYRGTLCARSPSGRTAISWLQTESKAPVFVDVNLRTPWWDAALVRDYLDEATWIKMNDDELQVLSDGVTGRDTGEHRSARMARALRQHHEIEALILTRGADGAMWIDHRGAIGAAAPPPDPLVDTVGAGDAFSAVTLIGLAHRWHPSIVLRRAGSLASAVCGLRGATTDDASIYRQARGAWSPDSPRRQGG